MCYRFATAILLLAFLMILNRGGHATCDGHANNQTTHDGQVTRGGKTAGNSTVRGPAFLAKRFAIAKRDLLPLGVLGFLFAFCALSLYASFNYMDAGLASTLLFLYPLEVALIMGLFFKEKLTSRTGAAILLSLSGIGLLYRGGADGAALSSVGLLLVFLSSLAYAVYIVVVNKARLKMGSLKLTFYVMIFCLLFLLLYSVTLGSGLPPLLPSPSAWGWAFMLGLVPSVLSLVFMAKAVKIVGSTATAIMGGLEPLTAVMIGSLVFGETMTARLVLGIVFILASVVVLAVKKKQV